MKKPNIQEEDEALTLVKTTASSIQLYIENFVEESTVKGSMAIYEESANFAVTMKLERKKGANKG